jgi:hypothetical protein
MENTPPPAWGEILADVIGEKIEKWHEKTGWKSEIETNKKEN